MACSRFLRPPTESHGRLYRASERVFDAMLGLYQRTLRLAMRHKPAMVLVLVATLALTGYLASVIPKGFMPAEDTGQIFAFTEAAQDISFDAMATQQQQAAAIVQKNAYVDNFMSSIGASGISASPNQGRMFIRLKPRAQRPSAEEVIRELRPQFARLPDMKVYPQILPSIRIGGNLSKAQYQYTLQDADLKELYHWAPIVTDRIRPSRSRAR
jgi:HAE1 family hydrophobic/amphiphilic exporter-1